MTIRQKPSVPSRLWAAHSLPNSAPNGQMTKMAKTKTGQQTDTSRIERLNATFRASLAGLTRRGRRLAKNEGVLEKGMRLVGGICNFCEEHRSLRVEQAKGKKWAERTPAMAAGWTDHPWSMHELLSFRLLHG